MKLIRACFVIVFLLCRINAEIFSVKYHGDNDGVKPIALSVFDEVTLVKSHRNISWHVYHVPEHKVALFKEVFEVHPEVAMLEHLPVKRMEKKFRVSRSKKRTFPFNDPSGPSQWHFDATQTTEAWEFYTGNGVNVQVVDDGADFTHLDLAVKHDIANSWNIRDGGTDVSPDDSIIDNHGTACSGLIGAVKDNSKCGCGVAYDAMISCIKLLTLDPITDSDYAEAVSGHIDSVDISSNSWGSPDDSSFYTSAQVFKDSLQHGAENGRSGKGVVYIWAAGNGGVFDNCNRDEYSQGPYVIPVTGITSNDAIPWFAEPCTANFVSSPTGGIEGYDIGLFTISTSGQCLSGFSGTSGAAPIVSGIVALILEANPSLTYRDVMYILLESSIQTNPSDLSWTTNSAGIKHSNKFGFGVVNALSGITLAENWTPVADLVIKTLEYNGIVETIADNSVNILNLPTTIYGELEHIIVYIEIDHSFAFDLSLTLTSPSGVESLLFPSLSHYINIIFESSWVGRTYLNHITGPSGKAALPSNTDIVFGYTVSSTCEVYDSSGSLVPIYGSPVIFIWDEYSVPGTSCHQQVVNLLISKNVAAIVLWSYEQGIEVTGSVPVYEASVFDQLLFSASLETVQGSFNKDGVNEVISAQTLTTVKHWGENPFGEWTVTITDDVDGNEGLLNNLELRFYTLKGCTQESDHLIVFGYCQLDDISLIERISVTSTGNLNTGNLSTLTLSELIIEEGGIFDIRPLEGETQSLNITSVTVNISGTINIEMGSLKITTDLFTGSPTINNPSGVIIIDAGTISFSQLEFISQNATITVDDLDWTGTIRTDSLYLSHGPLASVTYFTSRNVLGVNVVPKTSDIVITLVGLGTLLPEHITESVELTTTQVTTTELDEASSQLKTTLIGETTLQVTNSMGITISDYTSNLESSDETQPGSTSPNESDSSSNESESSDTDQEISTSAKNLPLASILLLVLLCLFAPK